MRRDSKSIAKGATISDADREELAELLWRLRTFDGPQLFAWADAGPTFQAIAAAPSEHIGELAALQGRVTKVERRTLPDALAARLEMTDYFECQLTLDGGGKATLITSRVPKAWLKMSPLDEPASAAGVFIRMLATDRESPHGLFVGREVAWHPTTPNPPTVSLGKSILGELGVDVGLLDSVRQREPIAATEREPFYQLLDAAGRIGANQLTRFATQDLDAIRAHWAAEEQRLAALGCQTGRKRSGASAAGAAKCNPAPQKADSASPRCSTTRRTRSANSSRSTAPPAG